MAKTSWRTKESKDNYSCTYTGDLKDAIIKAEKDLERYKNDPNIMYWNWIKDKATNAITANKKAIKRAEIFIRLAKEQMKKEANKVT